MEGHSTYSLKGAAMSKFSSLKDEVVYRATLNGFCADEIGTVDDIGWHGLLLDFHGKDYIVREDLQGFVTVKSFATTYEEDGKTYRSAESGNAWLVVYDEHQSATSYEEEYV